MERYQVILAYDGSPYQGFQRQGRGKEDAHTVQGVVEAVLHALGWQGDSILAAGRTDTGVHAAGQVIAFDLAWKHTPEALCKALNAQLPPEIAARRVQVVPSGFHPRFDAVGRQYVYSIYIAETRDPLRERYAWRVWPSLDATHLQQAARLLIGKHDFAAFGTPPRANGSTWRTVQQSEWQREGDHLTFHVAADAFLYHMVRRMVYVQVAVANGRVTLDSLSQAISQPTGDAVALKPGLAPPQGLVLNQVFYLPGWQRTRMPLEQNAKEF